MGETSLFVVGLAVLLVVLVARALASRLHVPEAILLVLLGVAAGFVPGMPELHLSPELVLLGFLPPLVYNAAFFTSPREARADAVPIITLAFGLTVVTTFAAGAALHWAIPALGWTVAIALGAAIAPTDPVSATSILQRVGAPPRIVTILEGESLINDGAALTAFGLAVEALTGGHGAVRLVQVVLGGIAYGLAVGWVIARIRRRIRDPGSQVIVSLLTPYLAYVPAEQLGLSGVLATVAAGFYLGTRAQGMLQPASRLSGRLFWRVLVFLLESTLFVLLGLQIRGIVRDMADHPWSHVLLAVLAVSVAAIVVRLAWALLVFPLARYLPGRHLGIDRMPPRQRFVIGWSGMRGAISLAIVLTLPVTAHGHQVPYRSEMIFVATAVVFITLIGQATTLAPLLRLFGMAETDRARVERMEARRATLAAALDRLDELAEDGRIDERTTQLYRQLYEERLDRVRAQLGDEDVDAESVDTAWLRTELVDAQREKLHRLYAKGRIGGDTVQALERRLDLEDPHTRRAAH